MNVSKRVRLGGVMGVCFLVAGGGCAAPSLSGLGEEGRVDREGLVGAWATEDGQRMVVEKGAEMGEYRVGITLEDDRVTPLKAHVVDLGEGELGFDATLTEEAFEEIVKQYGFFVIPAYQVGIIEHDEHSIHLLLCDPDWYGEQVGSDPNLRGVHSTPLNLEVPTGDASALRVLLRRARAEDKLKSVDFTEFSKVHEQEDQE